MGYCTFFKPKLHLQPNPYARQILAYFHARFSLLGCCISYRLQSKWCITLTIENKIPLLRKTCLKSILTGNHKLTGFPAPCFRCHHLMVYGHKPDQQNRPEQKISDIPPQFLNGEKRRDHLGSRAKPPPELFIGRVSRFVIGKGPTPLWARLPANRHCALPASWISPVRAAPAGSHPAKTPSLTCGSRYSTPSTPDHLKMSRMLLVDLYHWAPPSRPLLRLVLQHAKQVKQRSEQGNLTPA